jgi:hypothetical protein
MLAAGSTPIAQFTDSLEAVTEEFVKAMGDSSNFGLAKSLFGAATSEGVDIADRKQFERWMAEFNNRPEEERRRVIPDAAGAVGGVLPRPRPSFTPVVLSSDEEIEVSRAEAPVLGKLTRLAAFVGDGRPLTKAGNLTLADARALVALLAIGDHIEETYGDRTVLAAIGEAHPAKTVAKAARKAVFQRRSWLANR